MAKLGETIGRVIRWKNKNGEGARMPMNPAYIRIRDLAIDAARPGVGDISQAFATMGGLLTPDIIGHPSYYTELSAREQMRVVELLVKGGPKSDIVDPASGNRIKSIDDPRIPQLLAGFLTHTGSFKDGDKVIKPEDPHYVREVRSYFSTWGGVNATNLDRMSEQIGLPARELKRSI